jgi:biopolymer transport protein ExbB/TolQ
MEAVTQVLYLISDALLIPVIILLLFFFLRALMLTGALFNIFLGRARQQKSLAALMNQLRSMPATTADFSSCSKYPTVFACYIDRVLEHKGDEVRIRKVLSDCEMEGERELGKCKLLIRTGPMLGLMGTLIPMGPALVALAGGNLDVMAQNMRIAFSTTVVGIFIGGIGFFIHLLKRRWYLEDARNLSYCAELLFEKEHQ